MLKDNCMNMILLYELLKQKNYIDDPKLRESWRIVLKFEDRHLYDVPEKENSETENDELHITNDEVYQDVSLEKVQFSMIQMIYIESTT